MSINRIDEFAKNGDKSISGLTLTTGFPRQQKPYRQWMNYLFNLLSAKTNEVVDAVNALDVKIEPLLKPIAVGEGFFTVNNYQSASEVAAAKGYGTWQRFAEGRTLVGYSSSTSEIDEYRIMSNEFGENEHTLTVEEMPSHKHSQGDLYNKFTAKAADVNAAPDSASYIGSGSGLTVNGADNTNPITEHQVSQMSAKAWTESTEQSIGGDQPHNNIQPSIVVAYWLRTA